MPIKNLTDNVLPRFPRLGKLRKGDEKQENSNRPGADLTYFRFVGETEAITAAFTRAYGEQPALLNIYLPHAAPDDCFQTWKEKWSAGGLVHRCDGQTMAIWRTPEGAYARTPKACDGGCDEIGRLEIVLPELIRAGHVGYVTLETHSINDLIAITATLRAAYEARNDLRGIEFTLRRVAREISTPSGQNGQRARREKWLVELTPSPRWAQLQIELAQSAALALPAPIESVDTVTGEIIDAAPKALTSAPAAQTAHTDPPARAPQPKVATENRVQDSVWPEPDTRISNANSVGAPKPSTGELKGNGKRGKQASLRIPANHFIAFCDVFAQKYPDYRLSTGDPDRAHVLYTAAAIGYPEINASNWDVVTEMLDRHAQGLPTQVPLS